MSEPLVTRSTAPPWLVPLAERLGGLSGRRIALLDDEAESIAPVLLQGGASLSRVSPDDVRPWPGGQRGRFDAVIALQPWRASADGYAVLSRLMSLAPVILCAAPSARSPGPKLIDLHPAPGELPDAAWMRTACAALELELHVENDSYMLAWRRLDVTPLLVHVHIPKTGGQALDALLAKNVDHRICYFHPPTPSIAHWDRMSIEVNRAPLPRVLTAHAGRFVLPAMLGGRLTLYVGLVRNPFAQILSYLKYIKREYSTLTAVHRKILPDDCASMSIEDLARWHIDHAPWSEFGGLVTPVHFLTGFPNLKRARELATRFLVLGVTEQMDRSVALLHRKLASYGLALHGLPEVTNTTTDVADGGYDPARDQRLIDYAGEHLQVESEFYDWVVARFERDAAAWGVPERDRET